VSDRDLRGKELPSRPFVKIPQQCLELELRHTGKADRVGVGRPLGVGRRVTSGRSRARERKHGAEDQGILCQEVSVNTEEAFLDLCAHIITSKVS
jgi:hypothetical protein